MQATATSALTISARYANLSKRVNWNSCPALESTSMALSISFEDIVTVRLSMAFTPIFIQNYHHGRSDDTRSCGTPISVKS